MVYKGDAAGDTNTLETGTHSGTLTLTDSANHTLKANYDVTFALYANGTQTPRNDSEGGDYHYADATFQVPAGQWSAPQGSYTGTLTVVVSYN